MIHCLIIIIAHPADSPEIQPSTATFPGMAVLEGDANTPIAGMFLVSKAEHDWVVVSDIFYFHPIWGRFPF